VLRDFAQAFFTHHASRIKIDFSKDLPNTGRSNGRTTKEFGDGTIMSRPRLTALLLALVTLLVYLPATRNGFVIYDDDEYVTANRVVQNGLTWDGVKWAFTTDHADNWHPVTWLSHMTDCELFDLNAGAHHFVNVLIHAANAALLFLLLWRLTEQLWPGALVAALFAWHPLHVESVAWVSERKDVLSTFFALLTLLAYAKHVTGDKWQVTGRESAPPPILSPVTRHPSRFYWLSFLFFALGLMSKPMLVTLPFVMLLLDFWPLHRVRNSEFGIRNLKKMFVEKIPFFLLTAISCLATVLAQRPAMSTLDAVPLPFRLENAVVACAAYLLQIFWPAGLAISYPLTANLRFPAIAISCAVLGLISALAWRMRGRTAAPLIGWLWFLGTLVPVIGLVQVGMAAHADRYTYFPSVGIFIAVVFGAWPLLQTPRSRKIFLLAGLVALALCVALTENQLRFWRNSETLFRHAIAVTRDNYSAHFNLAKELSIEHRMDEALAELREAQRLAPGRYEIHNELAIILEDAGKDLEALAEFQEAGRLKPENPIVHDNVGYLFAKLGRFDEAMLEFTNALKLAPDFPMTHFQMGMALLKQGRDAEALEQLRAALRLDPDNVPILAYTARVLAAGDNPKIRDGQAALQYAVRANLLTGSAEPSVLDALGMACAEAGRFDDAQEAMRRALALTNSISLKNPDEFRRRLELYQNRQPWRESFRATNAPDMPAANR
jgi:tetratricopeptide (TPR) repeat protein